MGNLYFDYVKERENLDHVEIEEGFFTYRIDGEEFYLANIYLRPECRGTPATLKIMNKMIEVAKQNSAKVISANIYLNDCGFHRTLRAALNFSFTIQMAHNGCVTITKILEA